MTLYLSFILLCIQLSAQEKIEALKLISDICEKNISIDDFKKQYSDYFIINHDTDSTDSGLFGNYNLLITLQYLHKILLHINVDSAVRVRTQILNASAGTDGNGRHEVQMQRGCKKRSVSLQRWNIHTNTHLKDLAQTF